MIDLNHFYLSIPKKCCITCGQQMEEQAESYMTQCFPCTDNRETKISNE